MDKLYKRLRYFVNQLSCIIICTWMCWPLFNVRTRVITVLSFFVLWLLTTDLRWLTRKLSKDLIFICIFLMTFVPYIITGTLQYGDVGSNAIWVNAPLFFVGMFINHYYMYYKRDYIAVGRMAFVSLVMLSIGSIQTIRGLESFPMASRILATQNSKNVLYEALGIGGYNFVYSAVFVCIALLYFIIRKTPELKRPCKAFIVTVFALMLRMILKASYAIAVILILTAVGLLLVFKTKKRAYLLVFFGLLFLLVIPKNVIGDCIMKITRLFEGNVIGEKFTDLADVFLNNGLGGQTGARIGLYSMSLKAFLKNPLFGIYGPFGNINDRIGWHSGWLDLMGLYGLFSSLPMFIGILSNFKKQLLFYSGYSYYNFLLVTQLMFILFGFINPLTYVYQIGFALFFITPAVPFLSKTFTKKVK